MVAFLGLEVTSPRVAMLWHHGVNSGRLTPSEFVRVTSINAAQIFNIYPRKGFIGVGADADIAVRDPEATRKISVETHHQKVDYNIFEGMTVKGVPSYTLSQGKVVWANGKLDVVEGSGRYIDRSPISYEAVAKMNQAKAPRAVVRSAA